MSKIITIHFNFLEEVYYFLAHYKLNNDLKEYYITVMDGKLEKLLYGNHIIKEINGTLLVENSDNNEQDQLKSRITEALGEYLHMPVKRIEFLPASA